MVIAKLFIGSDDVFSFRFDKGGGFLRPNRFFRFAKNPAFKIIGDDFFSRDYMSDKIKAKPKKNMTGSKSPGETSLPAFPIVGIGGSAGGFEAFRELLKNLSDKTGMAFVFILHLSPDYKSQLAELLSRETKMPVTEAKSGVLIEANHAYVIPPNTDLSIAGEKLLIKTRKKPDMHHKMPIDYFFTSLAKEQGNRAIGVILSGTATDGTLGAEVIKAEGGITFAQDQQSAKYSDMPQHAISSGCIDFVFSPKKIASELEQLAKHPYLSDIGNRRSKTEEQKAKKSLKGMSINQRITKAEGFESIFNILSSGNDLDFTYYKATTVSRRVLRRMALLKLKKINDYVKYLRENRDEIEKLYEDLLINVTGFFRDQKVFDELKKQVLPIILKNNTKDECVRIWVPGCSGGEEVYSIAICILEVLGSKAGEIPVQIFATDVSEASISKARRGIYSKNIEDAVSPERLRRFFIREGNSYKVSKQLRAMCAFSRQNVFNDPPFSNIDLISCRNLLIYLQPVLQKKVFHNFHYALKIDGFLLLGNSEAAGEYSNIFKVVDSKQKIFIKKYRSAKSTPVALSHKYFLPKISEGTITSDLRKIKEPDVTAIADAIVLSKYAPCGVVINSSMEVIQFRGYTDRYISQESGRPSCDIFKLAREGLRLPLRAAIYKAGEINGTVTRETECVNYDGQKIDVKITVIPVKTEFFKEDFFLILFDEKFKVVSSKKSSKAGGATPLLEVKSAKSKEYINNLQKELIESKEYLQIVMEENESTKEKLETANEEILSSNEELQSANEELQSANEELETAKEELQSSNEELITSNEELQNSNSEISLLNNDLVNLINSVNIPVVMMGTDLVIRKITPQTKKVLNLIPSDIGQPINKIKLSIDIPDLEKNLLDVMDHLHPKTFDIEGIGENCYSVYIRPYRTTDNKIDGVVMILIDITERRKLEERIQLISAEKLRYSEEKFKKIFNSTVDGIIIVDIHSRKFIMANDAICRMLGYSKKELEKLGVLDIHPEKDIPYVVAQFEKQAKEECSLAKNLPVKRKDGSVFYADINSVPAEIAKKSCLIGIFHDTTEHKRLEDNLEIALKWQKDVVLLQQSLFATKNDLKNRLKIITDGIVRIFSADFCRIWLIKPGDKCKDGCIHSEITEGQHACHYREKCLHLVSSSGRYTHIDGKVHSRIPFDCYKIGRIASDKDKKFLSNDLLNDNRISDHEWARKLGLLSFAGYRLNIPGGETLGVLALFAKHEIGTIESSMLDSLSKTIAFVIQQSATEEDVRHVMILKSETEMKSKFTSMISHELRTPLSIINESVNIVSESMVGYATDEQKELLDIAKRNTERLGRLIDNVLNYQKMGVSEMVFDIRENNINETVQEVCKGMKFLAEDKKLNFVLNLENNLHEIKFDKDKIIQVITNLVDNAIKCTKSGTITVSTKREENMLNVSVTDTGSGVKPENVDKIFDAYNQIYNLDKNKSETGLGLAISKEIILAHKGKIWMDTEMGKGSSFHFSLPFENPLFKMK